MSAISTTTLFCFTLIIVNNILLNVFGVNPEVDMNFEQRVRYHGYSVELHEVATEDNYIIRLYRIPNGLSRSDNVSKNKSVILFVHGMGGAAINFIALGRDYAPAYYFANNSFDVWMICSRGVDCQNPRKHRKYDWNKDSEYWNFSYHEIGLYDVPASVDYITHITGQEKIFYIGHSSGGPAYFVMTTEKPEYNNKIKINANYGQASFMTFMDYPAMRTGAAVFKIFRKVVFSWDVQEALTLDLQKIATSFARYFCSDKYFKKTCFHIVPGLLGNKASSLMEIDFSEVVVSSLSRLALRQTVQYADNINYNGDFRKFDWGPKKNMKIYGQKSPPLYNMSKSTAMNAFFYGTTDSLSAPEDNWLTIESLPNTIYELEIGQFSHLDFVFAKNATFMVYEKTVKLFKEYDQGKIPSRIRSKRRNS